jgi:hypothetical protein
MSQPPSTPELIRAQIEHLQATAGGDWQSLKRQVDDHYKVIPYNAAQQIAILCTDFFPTVKQLDLEWGRGTGKTTVFARYARVIAKDMPRGSYQWIVPTYQKFLTEIIPAFIHAMEMQGLYKDLHYFIGKRPPARWLWPEPYKPPLRYDNFVTFWNGFGFHLLSQDIPGAGRGLSTDGEFLDEAVMMNPKKMHEDSSPSIRGSNLKDLGKSRWFDFRLKASSTALTADGAWFIEREEMAKLAPDKHMFLKANCVCNMHNLKPDYLEEARRTTLDLEIYNAEYLNIRPRFVRGGFYALLDEKLHTYTNYNYTGFYTPDQIGVKPDCRGDGDLDATRPLIVGMDFGAAINSITVSQQYPGEFRTLKDFFSKGAEGQTQDDACQDFCDYYQPHPVKEILFFHDLTGNHTTGNTKLNKAQQAEQFFLSKGWKVRRLSLGGTNPRHFEKYRLWERILQETDNRFPRFRINRQNAKFAYLSMSRAKSKRGHNGEIKKDKSSETVTNKSRETATDLSDAQDNPVFVLYAPLLRNLGASLPDSSVHGR